MSLSENKSIPGEENNQPDLKDLNACSMVL